jgi:acetyl/propionyl-CoA carboxylase alpha subunit/acetyl-CoA carboxylase carboxyltransferase component
MPISRLLIANRGEIAIRIARAAAELGIESVAVHSADDANSLHTRAADAAHALDATGPAAYLDADSLVAAARATGCDAIHPGYGFLSENAAFARLCRDTGLRFVGPRPEVLEQLGDKLHARAVAARCGVPVLAATDGPTSLDDARRFVADLGPGVAVAVKAVAGGGGRGLRIVSDPDALESAYTRARSEAGAAFGNDAVYVERALLPARHIEIQIIGDGRRVRHLGERECSLQRNHQKLVEIAPSPTLAPGLRQLLCDGAVRIATELRYEGLGTFEFLVGEDGSLAFIEANPRLQVEHTVTEAVTGIDLVRAQIAIAGGATLDELGLAPETSVEARGHAIQLRINLERMTANGTALPAGGRLATFLLPSGPGVRVDTCGYAGYTSNPRFDSLIAKVIVWSGGSFADAVTRARRALQELHIEGSATNAGFLRNLLRHPDVIANRVDTGFLQRHAAELIAGDAPAPFPFPTETGLAGARVDSDDPLAVLAHGRREHPGARNHSSLARDAASGLLSVCAPLQGTVVSIDAVEGDRVRSGQALVVLEAMKMEHVVVAPAGGIVRRVAVAVGQTVPSERPLLFLEAGTDGAAATTAIEEIDLDRVRPDFAEMHERHAIGLDERRSDAVARRRTTVQRTARENLADLCDEGTFIEYGALAIAAQRRRRPVEDLIARTPADGLVSGVGSVNGALFPNRDTRCVVLSYDYMVLAGTQGLQNHRKKDRMFALAQEHRLPVVFFTEGGGGRPGDTDGMGVAGLDCLAFRWFAELSGLVPLVGINSGRCFAGNAALLGCCDVVIATRDSNIGMGGPAMIEGGGLGVFRPEEIGPIDVQVANGVVDIAVDDETEAVRVAKQYLSFFQGDLATWECDDQRRLRFLIPENRLRVYDVRRVMECLADSGSLLELRRGWAPGMVTALARVEGRALGIVANNPMHLGGAIDSDGADKAARFLQLCDAFGLPVLFLCDTPGIMVGPEAEKSGTVRHAARLFVVGASLDVPVGTIVLRKGYGLGAQAMAGGSFHASSFTVAWPTGEFGGMGLEGAVKLGFRKELEAIEDRAERKRAFDGMVAMAYAHGKATNMASHFEIDDVIDPADSRRWVRTMLTADRPARTGRRRPCVDPW